VSLNITQGEGGWQKRHVTFLCDFSNTLFASSDLLLSHTRGEGEGEMTPNVTWDGGSQKCRKSVTYYLNGPNGHCPNKENKTG
jgi:hypothetical protein